MHCDECLWHLIVIFNFLLLDILLFASHLTIKNVLYPLRFVWCFNVIFLVFIYTGALLIEQCGEGIDYLFSVEFIEGVMRQFKYYFGFDK